MEIRIRDIVKQLLENEYLIVNYIEYNDNGFDLSVRVDTKKLNEAKCHVEEITGGKYGR